MSAVTRSNIKIGGRYNWKHDPKPSLVYQGKTQDHNQCRGWYNFAAVESPGTVWCQVREEDLAMFEETVDEATKEMMQNARRYAEFCRNPQVAAWCNLDPHAPDVLQQLDAHIDDWLVKNPQPNNKVENKA